MLAEAGGEGSEPMRVTVPHGASQEAFRFIVPTSAVIKGHVSLSDTELPDPAWAYIAVHEQPAGSSDKPFGEQVSVSAVDTATGTFASAPISCGRYLLRLHVGAPDSRRLSYFCGEVVVGGPDDGELSLHPQADLLEK